MSLADNQAALCYLWLFSNMINLTYYKAGDFLFQDKTTKPWIVAAITKIAAQIGYLPENIKEIIIKDHCIKGTLNSGVFNDWFLMMY